MNFTNSRGLLRFFIPVLLLLGANACDFLFEFEQTEPTVIELIGADNCQALTNDVILTVNCDVKWTASMDGVSWARIESQTSTSRTEGLIVLSIDPNRGTADRYCTVVLTAGSLSISKTITQFGISKYFNPGEITLTGMEESILSFESPDNWVVSVGEGEEWIKLQNAQGEAGLANVLVSAIDANENVGSRSGMLNVNIGNEAFTIPVVQGQKDVVLADGASASFDYKGGDLSIATHSNINYKIEISDRWIKHVSTKALNDATELFSVERNSDVNPRTATILFTGIENPDVCVSVTVNQEGINPLLQNRLPGLYGLGGQTYTFGQQGWNLSSRVQNANGSFEYRIMNRSSLSVISITGIDPEAADGSTLAIRVEGKQKADTFFSQSYSASVLGSDEELIWLVVNSSVLLVIQK